MLLWTNHRPSVFKGWTIPQDAGSANLISFRCCSKPLCGLLIQELSFCIHFPPGPQNVSHVNHPAIKPPGLSCHLKQQHTPAPGEHTNLQVLPLFQGCGKSSTMRALAAEAGGAHNTHVLLKLLFHTRQEALLAGLHLPLALRQWNVIIKITVLCIFSKYKVYHTVCLVKVFKTFS